MPSPGVVDPTIRRGHAAPEEQTTTTTTTTTPCDVLHSTVGLSFWGGIDPLTGIVIDSSHPLRGSCVSGKVLCVPSGRGSCTGSQVMLELILKNIAPRAILLRDADAILCAGAIIAEEFFGDECRRRGGGAGGEGEEEDGGGGGGGCGVPIIAALGAEDYARLEGRNALEVVRLGGGDDVRIRGVGLEIFARDLLRLERTIRVAVDDEKNDDHDESSSTTTTTTTSPAEEIALRTIERVAAISGATELVPVTRAHVDAVTYVGDGGLRFARRLVELGGRVKVRTTMNAQSCDRRRWMALGVDPTLAANANAVGDAYLDLGCEMSFTCAPYLLPSRPGMGEDVAWGESNAVVFANSVIGARTEKYADYIDILAAIVGLVPNVGVHVERNRAPEIVIDATRAILDHLLSPRGEREGNDDGIADDGDSPPPPRRRRCEDGIDSFFPVMGWTCGNLSDGVVPLILGFDLLEVTNDDLKAFCAAFGTTGSAPLFHMANVTPEAMGDDKIECMLRSCGGRRVEVTAEHLCGTYETLDSGNDGSDDISLVALGNPHLSIEELGSISNLIDRDDRPKHDSVDIIATLGRHVQLQGEKLGYIQKLESFGVRCITDTCWCMLLDPPIIPSNPKGKILTNSGKYAHYGPGLTNRSVRFGSLYNCIEAAKCGKMNSMDGNGGLPQWLRSSTRCLVRSIKNIK